MIFFDILVYLAVAKIAVLLLEDAAYAVRGKQSPRRQARARLQGGGQKAGGSAGASAPAGAGRTGSTVAAADGYLAGLIEDATERARARRRRAVARKRGAQAVDGVVVDVDDDGRWYADCDLCGWSSRPYRIEANAQGAGRDHTRTEHPDQYTGQPQPTQSADSVESSAPTAGDGEQEPRRPALRVIPGGAQDTQQPVPQQPAGRTGADDLSRKPASPVARADGHFYCQTPDCPECRPPRFEWWCNRCGERSGGSFTSIEDAEESGARHTCSTPETSTDAATPAGPPPSRDDLYARCAHREIRDGQPQWCDNPGGGPDGPFCDDHRQAPATPEASTTPAGTGQPVEQHYTRCDACGFVNGPTPMWPFHCPRCGAGDDRLHPASELADNDQGLGTRPSSMTNNTTEQLREMTVNLEATGPEEIRAAFTQAAETAGENAETIGGIAGVLTEAADRYEGLDMAASTVGHLRDAAEQFAAAQAALNTAEEELQAALADFTAKDGAVAETVAETGGNVASKEVLVG
ncbi:hypothetical protein [Micromonospora carbonacea]|uniref:hypothetical protein n=1 Tax=Micromonospora carbonacea TaxID=47853 RepID=UPI003D736C60